MAGIKSDLEKVRIIAEANQEELEFRRDIISGNQQDIAVLQNKIDVITEDVKLILAIIREVE